MKTGWKKLPFEEVIADVSGGNVKTPQGEFLPEGRFAIVDQGKELISGYVNEEKRLCHADLPVIIFGDHTRCFKYVDFPFCMGADGVKVLRPKIDANVKYLYYYLRQLHITDAGYSRHFKYLKQSEVVLPSLEEQKRIADILDRAEALRAKRRASLAQLDELTQSIFVEMFGDPTINPKNWDEKSLGNLCSYIIDCPHSTPKYEECITPYPCIRTTELKNGYIDWSEMKYISEEGYKERTKRLIPAEGDVVYGREGSFGEAIRIPKNTNICLGQRVMLFRPNHNLCNSVFLWALVRSNEIYQQALKKTNGSTVGHVNVNDIKKFTCFCPPLLLQDEFSAIIKSIEILKEKQQQSLLELNNLFDSLAHEAFTGKLFSHQFFEREIENGVKI